MVKSMVKKSNGAPNHVAFIMDGNRRWAEARSLAPWKGHEEGAETVEKIVTQAVKLDIPYFSFWGSSLDNISKRSPEEVMHLLDIFKNRFKRIAKDKNIHDKKIKISVLGRWKELFPAEVKEAIQEAIDNTKNYSNYFLNFLLAYSGMDEMESAIKNIITEAKKNLETEITPALVKSHLFTKDLPPVDFLIRTGGSPHLSTGFMMWDTADAQLYFSEKTWPDFAEKDFTLAVEDYISRTRKFGA